MALYSALRLVLGLLGLLLQYKARRAKERFDETAEAFSEASKRCSPNLVKTTEVALLDQRAVIHALDDRENADASAAKWASRNEKVQKVRSWFSNTSSVTMGYVIAACDVFTVLYVVSEKLLGISIADMTRFVIHASGSAGE
jgi:hypothetical protein